MQSVSKDVKRFLWEQIYAGVRDRGREGREEGRTEGGRDGGREGRRELVTYCRYRAPSRS